MANFSLLKFEHVLMVKTNSNYAVNVAQKNNHSLPIYLINHLAQISTLFNMSLIQSEILRFNRTYFINISKMSDVASFYFNILLYWIE